MTPNTPICPGCGAVHGEDRPPMTPAEAAEAESWWMCPGCGWTRESWPVCPTPTEMFRHFDGETQVCLSYLRRLVTP